MNPAEIFTLFDQNVLRSGCTETTAHDGGVALYFDNTAGQSAKDKITLTGSALGADDFTLRLTATAATAGAAIRRIIWAIAILWIVPRRPPASWLMAACCAPTAPLTAHTVRV